MPPGEEMFKYHGYSGSCPKPPLPSPAALPVSEEPRIDAWPRKPLELRRKDTPENRAFWASVDQAKEEWERVRPDWSRAVSREPQTLHNLRMRRFDLFRQLAEIEIEILRCGGVVDGRNIG
jgi:hypothetical protein